jgi:benzylsuccinate CoA-transferase BbsF subunit
MPQLGRSVLFPGAPYRFSKTGWAVAPAPRLDDEDAAGWLREQLQLPRRNDAPDAKGRLPLRGLRVLDFGTNVVTPMTCKLLAAYGAEVIKVEGRSKVDGQRNTPVPRPWGMDESPNTNWLFMNVNPDKRSLAVNMQAPQAHELVKALIKQSDVMVDNFGVDPMPKWGMSADEIFAFKPDMIITRLSVMGRTGSKQNYVGLGNSIMATVGLNSMMGFPGEPPVATCTAHPDYSSNAHHALFSIMSALFHREMTGEGQVIDLSQTESTLNFVGTALMDFTVNGVVAQPSKNRHPQMSPHGVYRCAGDDNWIAIACSDEEAWAGLCSAIPSLAEDARFATLEARKANEDVLDAIVSARCAARDSQELAVALQALRVPAGAVNSAPEMLADPQFAERAFFVNQDHPESGPVTILGPHFRLGATPGVVDQPAPLLSDGNDWVSIELLGYEDDALADLYVSGAIE